MSQEETNESLSPVEEKLAALMQGATSRQDFLRVFLESRLYLMLDGEPQGTMLGDCKPMVIAMSADAPRMLAVFSSPDRAQRMLEHFSEYSYPILVPCAWALQYIGPHMGIAFNPGCANGFELAPEGAQQLKHAIAEAGAQSAE